MSDSPGSPWTAAYQASWSITKSQNLLKLMSIESVMPSNPLILCHPFSCLQSFPASGSFLMVWLFTSGGQANFASASAWVLSMNIQDWFPLGLTGLISLQSKGLSRVFSSTTVWKHQFFGAQPSSFFLVLSLPYGLTLTGLFVIHNKFLSITFDFMLMR